MQDIAILRTLASYPYVVFSPSLPVHSIMPPCDEMCANPFSAVFDQSHLPYGTSPGMRLSDRARAVLGTMRGPPPEDPPRAGPCGGNGSLVDAKLPTCLEI